MVWLVILCSRSATRESQTDLRAAGGGLAWSGEGGKAGNRSGIHREAHSA